MATQPPIPRDETHLLHGKLNQGSDEGPLVPHNAGGGCFYKDASQNRRQDAILDWLDAECLQHKLARDA